MTPHQILDRVIVSANEHGNHIEFWPLIGAAWQRLLSVPVTLAFVTRRAESDPLITELRRHGDVRLFPEVEGLPSQNVTKVARYLAAMQYPDEVCLIDDIDLLPLTRDYFVELLRVRQPGELLAVGAEVYAGTPHAGKFPIGNLTAEGRTFSEVFNPHGLEREALLASWKGVRVFDHKEAIDADPAMFSDESLLRGLVHRWGPKARVCHARRGFYPYESRAVDRANWQIDLGKLKQGVYVEAHLLRPLHLYWDKIWPLILYVMEDPRGADYWPRIEAALRAMSQTPTVNPAEIAYAHLADRSRYGQQAALVSQGLTPPPAPVAPPPQASLAPARSPSPVGAEPLPIAMVTETMNYTSGGIRCIAEVLNRLADRGYPTACYVTAPDLRCDWLPIRFPILPAGQLQDFRGVLISPFSPTAELAARSQALGKFYWVHSYEPKFPEITGRPDSWRVMSENSYRLPQLHYFATSTYVKMILELIYRREVLSPLVPGGVDTELFRPGAKAQRPLRVMFLSRENPFRGSADIVAALKWVREQGVELEVCVMGQPVNAPGLPHRHFPPLPQREFAQLLGSADVFIHASHFEGLPLPPLEAMACGCAVVATYVGASDYLLDGYNALVVPPKRPDKIAEALWRLAQDPSLRTRLAQGGLETVTRGYTWEHTVDRLLEALAEGMGRQGVSFVRRARPQKTTVARGDTPKPASRTAAALPAAARAFLAQADQAYTAGDFPTACAHLAKALEVAPQHPDLLRTLGSLRYQQGDLVAARELFARLREVEPDRPENHVQLAMVLVALKQVDEFEAALSRALELEPDNWHALKLLADLNLRERRYPDAAKVYGRLLQQRPEHVEVLLALGKCFYQSNEGDTARMVYEQVLKLDPHNQVARESLQVIQLSRGWDAGRWEMREVSDDTGSIEVNGVRGFLMVGDLAYLQDQAKALRPGGVAVEIGSFLGLSSIVLAHALRATYNQTARLFCVDTWKGSKEHQNLEIVRKGELFERFSANVRSAGLEDWITPIREESVRAAAGFPDASLDMIFVDGDHTEAAAYADLRAWHPKLKPDGRIFGHDCAPGGGVHRGVERFAREMDLEVTITEPPQAHYMFELRPRVKPAVGGDEPVSAVAAMPVTGSTALDEGNSARPAPDAAPSQPAEPPLVSAIVSAYRSERFIRGCLEDLEAQTLAPRLEIIVVDSGSPENERTVVEEFQQRYSNIVYLRTEQRETVYAAWNRGVRAARGRYLTNANTDDRHRVDAFEVLVQHLEAHPDVSLVYADCLITQTENESFARAHPTGRYSWMEFNPRDLVQHGCFVGPQPMWRREVHAEHGYFDESFVSAGDYEFWLRLAQNRKFLHVKETLGLYLESPGSVEHANRSRAAQEEQTARARYRGVLLRNDASTPAAVSPAPAVAPVTQVDLPAVAKVGRLKAGYDLLADGRYREAWQAGLVALKARPFHPEGYVMLGEIARAAGQIRLARDCGQRAQRLAPKLELARQLIESLPGAKRAESQKWPALPDTRNGQGQRISVCLIARNEEKFLHACLASIRPLAHQIVLVDTGSTDRTEEIARQHGAEVHHFAWNDDFSAARNLALEHATGDWVLMLDADEEFPASEHATLLKEMQAPGVMAYRLRLINRGLEKEGVCYVPRFFRNAPGLFFIGRIHEQVFPSIMARCDEWGLETRLGSATLVHHGYTPELTKSRNKVERNLRLLQQAVQEWPDEPSLAMNLGLELVRSGDLPTGLVHYREAFRLMSLQPPERHVPELREALLTQFACHLQKARAFEEVIQVLASPLARLGDTTASLHFSLGLAYLECRRYAEAAEQMKQCLWRRDQPALTPIIVDIQTGAPHHCLAYALAQLNQLEAAQQQYEAALRQSPESRPIRLDYALFLAERNPVEALKWLHQLVSEDAGEPSAWVAGGRIALGRPEFLEFADDWTAEAIQHLPDHPVINRQRAEVRLLRQDPAGALPLWRKAATEDHALQASAVILCQLASGESLQPVPPDFEVQVSQRFLFWYKRLVDCGALQLIQQLNGRLEELGGVLPTVTKALGAVLAETVVA